MNLLTPHFSFEELTASDYATRFGIDNTPRADLLANGQMLANGLERVRAILALPIHVSSGYRSAKLNHAVGGSKDSKHMAFLAADFTCHRFGSPADVARELAEHYAEIGFQTLIFEGFWVHIDFADDPKGIVLTAHFGPGPTTYTKGLA